MIKNKNLSKERSMLSGVLYGLLVSIAILLCGAAVITSFVANGQAEGAIVRYYLLAILMSASCVGALLSNKLVKKQYAIMDGILAAGLAILLAGTHIFLFEDRFQNVLTTILAIVLGCVLACMLSARKKEGKYKRRNR